MEWAASHRVNVQNQACSSSKYIKNEMHWNYAKGHAVKGFQSAVDFWYPVCWSVVFSLRALKAKRVCRFVLCHDLYVLVLIVKGTICLQCEELKPSSALGEQRLAPVVFLVLSRGTHSSPAVQFVLVAFFCTNTENCFNAGNWNYFNIFDCIPVFMSCWNVKCTWTVLLMLVCENMHFSINPFCTRLALTVFTGLGKLSAFSSHCFKQIPWGSMITIISLIKPLFLCCTQSCFGRSLLSLPWEASGAHHPHEIIYRKYWSSSFGWIFLVLFLNKLNLT